MGKKSSCMSLVCTVVVKFVLLCNLKTPSFRIFFKTKKVCKNALRLVMSTPLKFACVNSSDALKKFWAYCFSFYTVKVPKLIQKALFWAFRATFVERHFGENLVAKRGAFFKKIHPFKVTQPIGFPLYIIRPKMCFTHIFEKLI